MGLAFLLLRLLKHIRSQVLAECLGDLSSAGQSGKNKLSRDGVSSQMQPRRPSLSPFVQAQHGRSRWKFQHHLSMHGFASQAFFFWLCSRSCGGWQSALLLSIQWWEIARARIHRHRRRSFAALPACPSNQLCLPFYTVRAGRRRWRRGPNERLSF